ncbi:hypothetical protein D3C72_2407470 [compost metagenome]
MLVQHLIVPIGFAAVTVDGVVQAIGRGKLKVHRLARERPQTRGNEEQPRQQLGPIFRRAC